MLLKNNIITFPETKESAIRNAQKLLNSESAIKALKKFKELAINGDNDAVTAKNNPIEL